jgi:hypothetical protein
MVYAAGHWDGARRCWQKDARCADLVKPLIVDATYRVRSLIGEQNGKGQCARALHPTLIRLARQERKEARVSEVGHSMNGSMRRDKTTTGNSLDKPWGRT